MKLHLTLILLLFNSIVFSQNDNLGKARTLKFTKQVDNKFVEIVFQAQPGNYLGGETYFKFKLEQIIVHQWEIDGKLYTSSNSKGILPANGKLGHVYLDVKIKTINNPFNEFWVKEGFQMNNMTDFQDIDYDGRTDKNWWINYAHISDVNINSVHFSNWFEIEKQLKVLEGNNTTINNQTSNNNTTAVPKQNKTSNTSSQVQQVAKEMNLRADELKILEIVSNTDNLNDALAQLNQLGYQNFNKYTIEALNKLSTSVADFPLTGNEMNTLLNGGSFKDIQKSYNLRQSTKVAQKLGLNSSQTELLNIISTSENNEDLNQRIKAKNIRDVSNLSQNALNKILGDNNTIFPASSSDITDMINGNWEQALTNINNEIQVRNTMNNTGFDRQTSEGINALGTAIGSALNESYERKQLEKAKENYSKALEVIKSIKPYDKSTLIVGKKNNYNSIGFDEKWKLENSNNFDINFEENILIIDKAVKKCKNRELTNFATFQDDKFNPNSDFTISFEYGTRIEEYLKNKKRQRFYVNLFDSYIVQSSALNNLSIVSLALEETNKKDVVFGGNPNINYDNEHNSIRNAILGSSTYVGLFGDKFKVDDLGVSTEGTIIMTTIKKPKIIKNTNNELLKLLKKADKEGFIYSKISVIKKNNTLYVVDELNYEGVNLKLTSKPLEYRYIKNNKITISSFIRSCKKMNGIRVKNFEIKQ